MAQAPIEQDGTTPAAALPNVSGIAAQAANAILTNKPLPTTATTTGYAAAQADKAVADKAAADAADAAAKAAAAAAAGEWTTNGNQALYKGVPFSGMRNGLQFINGYRQDMYDPYGKERTTTTTTTTTPTADTGVKQSAKDIVNKFLKDAGLAALTDDVWSQWKSGTTSDQILDYVRSTPAYAVRFPAMATLNSAGRAISEADYIAKEQADINLMTQYGLPSELATSRELLGNLIAKNVDQVTLQKRLIAAQDSVLSKDQNVLDYGSKVLGLTTGDLMAFYLSPDIATPIIEQKAKAAQIGGAAFQAKQAVDANQAMALAAAGVTGAQAQQGFGNIAQQAQFQQELPGDVSGSLSNEELVNAQFGMDPAALAKLKKVAATRAGTFQEGGQFTSSATGVGGIGSAPSV